MTRRLVLFCVITVAACTSTPAAEPVAENPLRLTLPPVGYAVTDGEIGVYFDNIVLTETPDKYRFEVTSDIGHTETNRWVVTPTEKDVGDHPWLVKIFEGDHLLGQQSMTWHVSPAGIPGQKDYSLLLIGDSLTHASLYPNELYQRLNAEGKTHWTMLGTHKPTNAKPGVAHEGYGGWTWQRFVTHYEPMPDLANRKHSSPFVFLDGDKPKLDVAKYIETACAGRQPDFVIVMLGINDCFGANANDPAALDSHIDRVFGYADTLIQTIQSTASQAELGLCLTTPPNARESGFTANYKGKYTRWNWKKIQHRLVEKELAHFGDQADQKRWIVPTELYIDPEAGYPVDNAVHPNATGYAQIAASMQAWLISRAQAKAVTKSE
ncbi:hypothetical protein GC163_22275 [bacterium]|nr:hypothetical protein [bacterium]